MFRLFYKIRDEFVPQILRRNDEVLTRANRMVAFHLAMTLWVPTFSLYYLVVNAPNASNAVLSGGIILIGSLVLLRRTNSLTLSGNILCGGAWYVYTMTAIWTGGIEAPVIAWYVTIPVLSILLVGYRWGIFWSVTSILTISAFAIANWMGHLTFNELTPFSSSITEYLGMMGVVTCVFILVAVLKNMEHTARGALHQANARLQTLASVDGLTGISNRRSFDLTLQRYWKHHIEAQLPLSVALIDTDLFKQYNDSLGHLAGDDCLRLIAEVIQSGIRQSSDLAARYGGEEFAVILADTDQQTAVSIVDEIRSRVSALEIPHPNSSVHQYITISIGVATMLPGSDCCSTDLLHEADRALYSAKRKGRNQTVLGTSHAFLDEGVSVL